jgi:predicted NUDIX family phosphoesterase
MQDEKVLVFPAEKLEFYEQYFVDSIVTDKYLIQDILGDVLHPQSLRFMDRAAAEVDENFKQVIPYCVLTKTFHEAGLPTYFTYKRTKKGGEGRLHEKWSVGVGGHVNPVDADLPGDPFIYQRALLRELNEEVGLLFKDSSFVSSSIKGLIYDNSNAVGRVHFGVVHVISVTGDTRLRCTDPALAEGQWASSGVLGNGVARGEYENWSNFVVRHILH